MPNRQPLVYHSLSARLISPRWRSMAFLSAVIFLCAALSSSAKDLNVLTRVLYAAFFIEQGTSMCSVPAVVLSDEERSIFAATRTYSAYMKQRITADLGQDEVLLVLRSAADRARNELREVVAVLRAHPPDQEYKELSSWCKTKMVGFAQQILAGYDRERAAIEGLIDRAKR